MPVLVSEKTESLRKTRSGFIPVSTALSYHTPITHYKKTSERPENHLEQHQNVIYVPSERPPVKKRQSNIGSGQEQIELISSQHSPQILTAQSSLEQQEKNEVQESTILCPPNQSTSQDLESNTLPNFAITDTLGAPTVKHFWCTPCTTYENVELKESEFSTSQQEHGLGSKACSECTVISLFPVPIVHYETDSSASDVSQYFDAVEDKNESIAETEISAHSGSELNEAFEDRSSLEVGPKYHEWKEAEAEPRCHEWEEAEEITDVCCPSMGTGDQGCENRDDECLEQPVECKDNGEMYPHITHHIMPYKKQTFCLLSDSDIHRMTEGAWESLGRGIRMFPRTISSCLEQDTGGPYMSPEQESPVKVSRHCTTLAHTASSSGSILSVHTSL